MAQQNNSTLSMSLANPQPPHLDGIQKLATGLGSVGLLILLLAWGGLKSILSKPKQVGGWH